MPAEKGRSKFLDRTPRADEGQVPGVRIEHDVIAVLSGDWHLSHKAPIARSVEEDWYFIQEHYVRQVTHRANLYCCPLIIAGDIFDRWNSPAELINWTLDQFDRLEQPCYTVAGNHDLAYHNLDDIKKTAYWTLVRSGAIRHLIAGTTMTHNEISMTGFHYGEEENIGPCPERHLFDKSIHLAVIHAYVWSKGTGYPDANHDQHISSYRKVLTDYNAVLMGDNHKTILSVQPLMPILNPGSLMRRKADEIHHKPCVGLLHEDGSITLEYLDCSQDKFLDGLDVLKEAEKGSGIDLTGFLEELTGLADSDLNFGEAVLRFMETKGVNEKVRKLLLNAIGQG